MARKRTSSRGKGRGRPAGSVNQQADVVTIESVPCRRCGSERKAKLASGATHWGKTIQEYAGLTATGKPYRYIVRRRCRCAKCGQIRIEKIYTNDPERVRF